MAGVPALQFVRWNHRYDLCETRGGFSLAVDEAGIARLLHMSELVSRGVPEEEAARRAKGLAPQGVTELPHQSSNLVEAALRGDVAFLDNTLINGLSGGPYAERCDDWLLPEMRRIGEAWASEHITSTQEEFVSNGVLNYLYGRLRATPTLPPDAPRAVLGLAPGEHHVIPLLSTCLTLREGGMNTEYIGANVSLDDWVQAIDGHQPDLVVMAARSPQAARAASDVTTMIVRRRPGIPIWVGGQFAHRVRHARVAPNLITQAGRVILGTHESPRSA
ncbi:hypothetical protein GCM10027418_27950 [Mariniluteicoccus endophyticus]